MQKTSELVSNIKGWYDLIIDAVRNLIPEKCRYHEISILPCNGQDKSLYVKTRSTTEVLGGHAALIPYNELGKEMNRIKLSREESIDDRKKRLEA